MPNREPDEQEIPDWIKPRRFPFEQLVASAELQRLTNDGGNFSQEESLFEAERSDKSLKTARNCLSRRTMARPML